VINSAVAGQAPSVHSAGSRLRLAITTYSMIGAGDRAGWWLRGRSLKAAEMVGRGGGSSHRGLIVSKEDRSFCHLLLPIRFRYAYSSEANVY
jgi:hypothetical protein